MFVQVLFGHLFGDYLFQTKKMALAKSNPGFTGIWWCLIHSLIYVFFVAVFVWRFDPLFLVLVFLSHYPIDRYSLADKWPKLVGGRTFAKALAAKEYREFDIAFTAIVYTVVDNTMHLFLLWLLIR